MIKETNPYKYIGSRIHKIRLQKNMGREVFANALGLSVNDIDSIENGIVRITMDVLFNISTILETEINYFLTGLESCNIKEANDALDKYMETFKFMESLSLKQRQIFSKLLDNAHNNSHKKSVKK